MPASESTGNSDPLQVVTAFVSAINRHDVAGLSALMTVRHAFVDSTGKTVSGRETMAAGWREYFRLFPDFQIEVERMLADGALVAAFGSTSGTYNGRRGPVAENRISMPAAWRATVENGEVASWQVYADWSEGLKTIERDHGPG